MNKNLFEEALKSLKKENMTGVDILHAKADSMPTTHWLAEKGEGFYKLSLKSVKVTDRNVTFTASKISDFVTGQSDKTEIRFSQRVSEWAMTYIAPLLQQAGVETLAELQESLNSTQTDVALHQFEKVSDSGDIFYNWTADPTRIMRAWVRENPDMEFPF